MKRAMVVAMMMMSIPALARAQTAMPSTPELSRRHDEISLFEGTLVGAVNKAAHNVARDVQSHTSNANFFSGDARAKGFVLDGYGVFVYVEIPALDLTLSLAYDLVGREQKAEAAPGTVSINPDAKNPDAKTEPKLVIPSTSRDALQAVMDTGQKYRNEVKLALTDAMLDFSKNLELKPDEWLSVAARGNDSALTPGEILQLTTVVLRVKGSDLADYLAGRTTRDEARTKVEVRQF